MFVEGPLNIFLHVNADGTKVLVGMGDDDIIIAADFLEDFGLELGKVGFSIFWFEVTKNGTFGLGGPQQCARGIPCCSHGSR